MRIFNTLSALFMAAAIVAPVQGMAATAELPTVHFVQKRVPSPTCDRNRKACYAGSARTGTYGSRYVPPEAVRMCEDAYRACVGRR